MQDPGEGSAQIKDERCKKPSLEVEIIRFRFRIPDLCLCWKQELEKIEARIENGFFRGFGSCCRLALKTGKRGRKLSQERETLAFGCGIRLKQDRRRQVSDLGARGDGLHDDTSAEIPIEPATKDPSFKLRD